MPKFINNLSIRSRLTLVFSGVVCVAMIIVSLAVYRSVVNNLGEEVDRDLRGRAQDVSRYVAASNSFTEKDLQELAAIFSGVKVSPETGMPIVARGNNELITSKNDLAAALTYVQITDPNGKLLKAVPDVTLMTRPENQKLLRELIKDSFQFYTLRISPNQEQVRVFTEPVLQRGNLVGYVQTVRSLQEIQAVTDSITLPFVIGAIFMVAGLAVFGWWVTRKAFEPIENITNAAYRIGVNNDFAERIVVDPASNDEVSRLGRAFNSMLDRIDKNFHSQRQFIADSSHELRTPLTVIRGNLDLLRRNPDPQNQQESLRAIERESVRMQRLVQDLLLLAQADAKRSIELAEVQLDTVVLEVYMQAQVLASARHQLFKMEHFEAAQVEGDAEQLKRAILNLVENAIKYTQEGGAVTVALYGGKRWTRVVIKDNGVGVDSKDQPHIFDRFYRVDKARSRGTGGTGLGLAIVKHIVEAHGGRISLESRLGQGSTFTVWLPLLSETPPTPDDEAELEPTPQPVGGGVKEQE